MTPTRARRLGVQLPEVERRVEWPELFAMASRAEEIGLDSVWLGDHLLYDLPDGSTRGPWEAWTSLAALARALLTQSATHPGGTRAENLLATVQQRHPDATDDEARALFVRLRDILLRDAYWLVDDSSGSRHYRFALEPLRRWWHRRNSL